jgi:hypothetical protein
MDGNIIYEGLAKEIRLTFFKRQCESKLKTILLLPILQEKEYFHMENANQTTKTAMILKHAD